MCLSMPQCNHQTFEFSACLVSFERLARLCDKRIAVVRSLRVQEYHFPPGSFAAGNFQRESQAGCTVQGSGKEGIRRRPVVASR